MGGDVGAGGVALVRHECGCGHGRRVACACVRVFLL